MQQRPTRLWWLDIARGGLGLIFVLFLLTHFVRTIHDVLVVFGIAIIVDSLIDAYRITTQAHYSRRRWLDYLFSGISVLVGIACISQPYVAGILLFYLLLARFIARAAGELRAAWLHQGRLAGVEWLYAALLLLATVIGIVAPRIISAFFFFAIVLYLIIDNSALIARTFLLRFAPQRLRARSSQPTLLQADLSPELPATTRRAVVFVRHSGASGLGHVGWAFEWHNGWFNAGSVENIAGKAIAAPATMDFWSWHTLDPVAAMQSQSHPYDEYKVFHVRQPDPKLAWQTVVWESRTPYVVVEHNCSDVVYDILRTYGATALADPADQIVPNDWYAMLPGPSFPISTFATIPLHLHRMAQTPIKMAALALTIPPSVRGNAPRWRAGRAWIEVTAIFDKMARDIGSLANRGRQNVI